MSWYFVHEQQARGPIGAEELLELHASGAVQLETLVWKPGEDNWKPMQEYNELLQEVHSRPTKKVKVQEPAVDVAPYLATLDGETLRDLLWTCIMRYQYDLLESCEDARDALLRACIENCPNLDDDPEVYDLSDDFFMDFVLEVEGKEELWKYISEEVEAVKVLLQQAADIDSEMVMTIESLHILGKLQAALKESKQEEALSIIQGRPGMMHMRDMRGNTPLHLVASAGAVKTMEGLAASDRLTERLVNAANDAGDTPLHLAVKAGSCALAKPLLEAGGRVGQQNKDTSRYANGSWVVKDKATQHAIPLPQLDKTPLHLAAEAGDGEMLQLLVSFLPQGEGARLNALETRSSAGQTALQVAVETGDEEAVAPLLDAGANVAPGGKAGDDEGRTLLHLSASQGAADVLKLLLAQGKLDVNHADGAGWTPLHLAARRGSKAAVEVLLKAGADATLANAQGKSALNIAEVNKREPVVAALKQHATAPTAANGA